jgi:hypothetical protein
MAAIVNIYELNGAAPGVPTAKTSGTVRFKNADDAAVDLVDPLFVPGALTEYSYQKYLRLRIDGGGFTQLSNLRAYSDGASGFGAGVKVWFWTAGSYAQPEEPPNTLDPPHYPVSGSPQTAGGDLFARTSGAPIDLDAFNPGPFGNGSPAEWIGDFLVLAMEIEPAASQGILPAETLTFAYDEI